MTKEYAIQILREMIPKFARCDTDVKTLTAIRMAINSLEERKTNDVLDKIRAEIVELQKDYQEYGWAYDDAIEIIDKYKAESEKGAEEDAEKL